MKSTSIKVSLDMRRALKNGMYPIILRLTHNGSTTSIKTGYHAQEEDWDFKKEMIKPSSTSFNNVTRLNNEIQKKRSEALDNVLKIDDRPGKKALSVAEIKQKIIPESTNHSFYRYTRLLIKQLIKAKRVGTARTYKTMLNVLMTYNKGKTLPMNIGGDPKSKNHFSRRRKLIKQVSDLRFDEITYTFLTDFETYHLANGNGYNGLGVYMRTLRSVYNQAAKAQLITKNDYPFTHYSIKTKETKKRFLQLGDLKKIVELRLEPEHPCFHARNYFVFSLLAHGMNFSDIAKLKKTDLKNDRIVYARNKTGKIYDIEVSAPVREILDYYLSRGVSSLYVFPVIKREDAVLQYRDVSDARKSYNERLKDIAVNCGIAENLSSYVSRHSFATQAMFEEIPLKVISQMLGHSSLKTTETYLGSFPSTVVSHYNAKLLARIVA